MKKLLSLICIGIFLTSIPAIAEDTAFTDDWSDLGKIQDAWDGQKIITDDEFNKVIEQRTKPAKDKADKKFKKKMGEALIKGEQSEVNIGTLREIAEDYPTLLVPTNLISGKILITPGFYRVISAKNKQNKYTINFYQGNNLVGKIPAMETNDDFDAETVNFAKIIYSDNDKKAKVVYGCLEHNLIADIETQ